MSESKRPSRNKREAVLAAAAILGKRPPKELPQSGANAEWRGNHWRIWMLDGWVDLDDSLAFLAASEELADAVEK
ncbi:MAG: hypothetical protein RBU37_18365 [Myxococcota bacterium]|jgi:hypothetical protein|nr:hypothetical protein [Myxococcota bacterium]